MKIVVCGDWHLDWMTAGVERFDEVAAAVNQAINYAAQHADLFVFLGDLCDPESPRAWRACAFALERATALSIPSVWIPGNHDVVDDGHGTTTLSPLAAIEDDRIQVAEAPVVLTFGEVQVLCFPYVSRANLYDPEDVVRKMPATGGPVVMLSHLCLESAGQGSESAEMARGREMFLPAKALVERDLNVAVVLNGHYHQRQEVVEHGLKVQCAGSLAKLTRGERHNAPAFLVVEV